MALVSESPLVVAVGLYSPSCMEVEVFMRSCAGCESARASHTLLSVAMLDVMPLPCTAVDSCVLTSSRLSKATLRLRAQGSRINFQKTRALFKLLVARAPRAAFFVKADSDALLNFPGLQSLLVNSPEVDYVGKYMRIFNFRPAAKRHFNISIGIGKQRDIRFVYMQGGLYVLSKRAAASMSGCPRGPWANPWADCPGAYFTDIHNRSSARTTQTQCFGDTLAYNDDLYTGACMAEVAPSLANFSIASHPCFWSIPPRQGLTSFWLSGKLRDRCTCPVAVHALKDAARLQRAKLTWLQHLCNNNTSRATPGGNNSAVGDGHKQRRQSRGTATTGKLTYWVGGDLAAGQPEQASLVDLA